MAYYGTYEPFLHIVLYRRIPGEYQEYSRRLSLLYTSVYHTFCMVYSIIESMHNLPSVSTHSPYLSQPYATVDTHAALKFL